MFERRLKIFLGVLVLLSAVLMARAVVVQLVRHDYWTKRAAGLLETHDTTETTRGRILDCNGIVLAVDEPCTDAAVDYRAIISPPDPDWVSEISKVRLRARLGPDAWKHATSAQRKDLLAGECEQTRADIALMWDKLGLLYRPTDDRSADDPRSVIADLRAGIIQKVEMQRRWLWFTNFQQNQLRAADAPRWQRWLSGNGGDGPDIDRFVVEVGDEKRPHVILPAIDEPTANYLGKRLEQFPGLVLQPSIRRHYPQGETACHVLGRMSRVDRNDVLRSRQDGTDPSRQYFPNDEIGREGVEALCEPLLRGSRGQIERRAGSDDVVSQTLFVPGRDVKLTIDSQLQRGVQQLFSKFVVNFLVDPQHSVPLELHQMHGAAVVIDVKTGAVRALVSNPGFDLDQLDEQYQALSDDTLNAPLRDRATCDQLEPGSTVKPIIGLSAITQGVIGATDGIECTGDLYLPVLGDDGKPTDKRARQVGGRCWVASEWGDYLRHQDPPMQPVHHIIPFDDPHVSHYGHAPGFLSFSEALERSCNIFFETTADRLGPDNIVEWYKRFGFGSKTGIGILEEPGRRPDQFHGLMVMRRMDNCFAGIGQNRVWATTLQVANEAATLARDGFWMRPRLLDDAEQPGLNVAALPADHDLHLDPAGLREAKIGMGWVVSERAGSGRSLMLDQASHPDRLLVGLQVAGKTGSAQASPLRLKGLDAHGKPQRAVLEPSTATAGESKTAPWYWASDTKGTTFVHAWYMGYAPIEHPTIAFGVLVEYSPTGGGSASGAIARGILEQCVARGYLHPDASVATASR